jgi:hypothetical protein
MKNLYKFGMVATIIFIITMGIVANGELTPADGIIGTQANDQVGNGWLYELPTGNIVIISDEWNNGRGAVTCLTRAEFEAGNVVVSSANSLYGTTPGDNVGYGRVLVLTNGNYVVQSPNWDNGAMVDAGAATWVNGTTCIPANESGRGAAVSATNSLVGTSTNNQLGLVDGTALTNGNYVISSAYWDNGAMVDAGAAIWGNGTTGITGPVTTSNSLHGTSGNDYVGIEVYALTNGNYVVVSPLWRNGAVATVGAVTWANGATGTTGPVTTANSLYGTTADDRIGWGGFLALTNGNYVVGSYFWDNGAIVNAGAVIWGNGNGGTVGAVSTANSLYGTQANDRIGSGGFPGLIALTNGHYVIGSPDWDNGAIVNAGAVTWGDGNGGTVGAVSTSNSLYGTTANDEIGEEIRPLTNGNYVVGSHLWDNGASANVGAITWRNGTSSNPSAVSTSNSLYGTTSGDLSPSNIVALTNGNYIIVLPSWDNGAVVNAGAVIWGNGATGTTGVISTSNAIYGSQANDGFDIASTRALTNGNYVVGSPYWDNGAIVDAGAVTWGNGNGGTVGAVSIAISLVGSSPNDQLGSFLNIHPLTNGNYVVASSAWDNGAIANVGAVTWGDGNGGTVGIITPANSLIGSTESDFIGGFGYATAILTDGNYVVASPNWDNGAIVDVGAVTWGDGNTGNTVGVITPANSYVGSNTDDKMGSTLSWALSGGGFSFGSFVWDNGAVADVGIVAYGENPNPPAPPVQVTIGEQLLYNTMQPYLTGDLQIALSDIQPTRIMMTISFTDNAVATVEISITEENALLGIRLQTITFLQGYTVAHENNIRQNLIPILMTVFDDLLGNYTHINDINITDNALIFTVTR